MGKNDLKTILDQFKIPKGRVCFELINGGRINQTHKVSVYDDRHTMLVSFILQSINSAIFPHPEIIMDNLLLLSSYHPLKGLNLIETHSGDLWLKSSDEICYRLMGYVNNKEPDKTDSSTFFEAGKAVGEFHLSYLQFKSSKLIPVIKGFHNTPERFINFSQSLEETTLERISNAIVEIEFFQENKDLIGMITEKLESAIIPYRVTHNDTKIENILFEQSGKSVCLIDFDTVMPGAIAWDFGDSIRSMANIATEEERNIAAVRFDFDRFQAFATGYASVMDGKITLAEVGSLVPGCLIMAYEQGLRFLTDYLDHDRYYQISFESQNLIRAQVQVSLLKQMLAEKKKMETAIEALFPLSLSNR